MVPAPVELSIVVPVYQAEGCLDALHERLTQTLSAMGLSYEVVLVDDASTDGSWSRIASLSGLDPHVRGYRLSRNFGQHAAITAGLAQCRGERAIVMDCDLQDPPEEIPRLVAKAKEGFDVVLARRARKQTSYFRQLSARLYFCLLNRVIPNPVNGEYGSYSCISRNVIDAYLRLGDRNRYYLFILRWLGFSQASIDYRQDARYAGESAYTVKTLLRHAAQGVFFQSSAILYWIVYSGFAVSAISIGLAVYFTWKYFVHSVLPGWTSLSVLILGMGGVMLICVGTVGLYVAQIFEQVKGRPLYVIDRQTE